jgi:hypothetical protein
MRSWAFLKHYVAKVGFIDGWAGFVIAFGYFEATFLRLTKRYEATQKWRSHSAGAGQASVKEVL